MEDLQYIPIPQYPPFQLRSSLIDKDPVIWVHLLEGYIRLLRLLLADTVKLNVKSQQQLSSFLQSFLQETAGEKTKVFSLGAVNPDIRSNTATLRVYVFQLIKAHSLVKLGLGGASLWNFVHVYVEKNSNTVRGLLDGSYKSPLNDNKKSGNLSSISLLQKYLESEITNNGFQVLDLQVFQSLLGLHTTNSATKILLTGSKSSIPAKEKKITSGNSSFAEKFVDEAWIEILERLFAGGKSIHADTVKNVMVVSLLSLSAAKMARLVSSLGLTSPGTLASAPLLSSVILSDAYKQAQPGLEERVPFLKSIKYKRPKYEPKDVEFLVDMFLTLTVGKARSILVENDGNVERATEVLLENPTVIESLEEYEEPAEFQVSQEAVVRELERFKPKANETTQIVRKRSKVTNSNDTKNKTLTAALRLLYESDEDERDDTYDDQEHTSGSALETDRNKTKLAVLDDNARNTPEPEVEKNELNLFGYLKEHGEEVFDKKSRKLQTRLDMKELTKWSDEQLEGWHRMLVRSPRRFRLLEEQYVAYFGNRKQAEQKSKPSRGGTKASNLENSTKAANSSPSERQKAQNERNKSSRANHSRKKGHNNKTRAELAGMRT